MDKPTVEKGVETKFFKRHRKHMPAVLNLKKEKNKDEEVVKDLKTKL